jgi:hypothetical protein
VEVVLVVLAVTHQIYLEARVNQVLVEPDQQIVFQVHL